MNGLTHTQPASPPVPEAPVPPDVPRTTAGYSADLAQELDRIEHEERQEIDRREQERLARLRELARFD